ncbi:MAG TPA: hypothetical protein VMC85_06295 [Desulfomonilaceae bacterium]|nr:hypothetical protein [Desulfomonilaceae bacterium]
MEDDSPGTPRTVTITAVKDEDSRRRVAQNLSRITTGHPPVERLMTRLAALPWTLTRNATVGNARKLVDLLENLGATVEVTPPLPVVEARSATTPQPTSAPPTVPTPPSSSEDRRTVSGLAGVAETFSPHRERTISTDNKIVSPREFTLEPLSLGGILDRSFQICRSHFWKLLAIMSIPVLITGGIALLASLIVVVVGLSWRMLEGWPMWIVIVAAVMIIPAVIVMLIGLFYLSQGAMIHAVSSIYLGREILVKQAYRFVMARLGRFVLTSFLFAIAVFCLAILLVLIGVAAYFVFKALISSDWWPAIPWVIQLLMVLVTIAAFMALLLIPAYGITKLLLFDKVVIIEDNAYFGALKRSWNLVRGKVDEGWPKSHFMRLVVLLHLFILINLTMGIIFQAPGAVLGAVLSEHRIVGQILTQLLSTLGSLVGGIFGSVCLVVFYYDLRNRKEGFDLKMLAALDRH